MNCPPLVLRHYLHFTFTSVVLCIALVGERHFGAIDSCRSSKGGAGSAVRETQADHQITPVHPSPVLSTILHLDLSVCLVYVFSFFCVPPAALTFNHLIQKFRCSLWIPFSP